jgi:hypothetical protein
MGADRSLAKLRHRLGTGAAPSERTLKRWSKAHCWSARAAAHDERVTARVVAKVETAQATEQASAALCVDRFARAVFTRAADLVATAETIDDLKVIVEKGIEALKQLAVMTGSVGDRTAALNVGVNVGETPNEARARRRREIEAEFGYLGPVADDGPDGYDPPLGRPY